MTIHLVKLIYLFSFACLVTLLKWKAMQLYSSHDFTVHLTSDLMRTVTFDTCIVVDTVDRSTAWFMITNRNTHNGDCICAVTITLGTLEHDA